MSPTVSRLDQVYRSIVLSKFFSRGWGNPDNLKKLFLFRKLISNRELCQTLVDENHPIFIDKVEIEDNGLIQLVSGHFESPLTSHLPGLLPKEAETAYFQMVLPSKWKTPNYRPICIHMAGTGDHHFWRRRQFLAKPLLLKNGVASLILENPFYGFRKPQEQRRSNLLNVSDIFVMGAGLILESIALLRWCEREDYGPFCLHGISMGGHMASLAAASWPKPISLVPCLSWTTASGVFTQGVMAGAIDWESLEKQLITQSVYRNEISKMLELEPDDTDNAYLAGKDFVIQYAGKDENTTTGVSNNSLLRSILIFLKERGLIKMLENVASAIPASASSKIDIFGLKAADIQQWLAANSSTLPPEESNVQQEALQFMRGIMDECTHLKNFGIPIDPGLIIVVAARNDAYIPREGTVPIDHLWPGCEIRYVEGGHISSYILQQGLFRKTIAEAIDRQKSKYLDEGKTLENQGVQEYDQKVVNEATDQRKRKEIANSLSNHPSSTTQVGPHSHSRTPVPTNATSAPPS